MIYSRIKSLAVCGALLASLSHGQVASAASIASSSGEDGSEAEAVATAPLAVPGGNLDPNQKPFDVYLEAPTPAVPDSGTACGLVEQYVKLVNESSFSKVANLFAVDALLMEPNLGIARGHEQINDFYVNYIGKMAPVVIPVAYIGTEHDCVVALSSKRVINGREQYYLASMDHFTTGRDGTFIRMIAFTRAAGARER